MDDFDSRIQGRLKPQDGSLDLLADKVNELRTLFKTEYEQNQDIYDKRDYDRFMELDDDWHARRWIIYQRDVSLAFELLKDTMQWRKKINLNDLSYEDFPREFYECGCVFEYGRDKNGRRVVYIRCRLFRPMSELNELYDNFFAFVLDQCDKISKSKGFTLMYDVTDAGLSNVEMSTLKSMINLKDRYPLSSRTILIVGLPWLLAPIFKVVMSMIPANQAAVFKTINMDELNQFIEDNQVPSLMGGTAKAKFQVIPENARGVHDYEQVSQSTASKLRRHVEAKTDPNDFEIVPTFRVIR